MKTRIGAAARAALLFSAVTVVACQGGGYESAQNAALDTDDQKASYAIGLQIGGSLSDIQDHVDYDAFTRGVQDAMAEREPVIAQAELQEVMMRFQQAITEEQTARMDSVGGLNQAAGESFLAENAAKEGVTVTESGLQYEVLREGDGARPQVGDGVTVHYRGTLPDGTEFDSSYARDEPASFEVGPGVIPGFAEALQLMPVGSQYRFVFPGSLGYGPTGNGAMIGPNQALVFEIELISIPE
jgi:FKBP-type peptidyl-prolyl cis-trans isomerase